MTDPSSILIKRHDRAGEPDVRPPAEVADILNRLFPFDSLTRQFTTLVYGVLETSTGEFRYVSAGHPGPVHVPLGGPATILESSGFPIGVVEDDCYCERRVRLAPGDRLYLYSDGVTDAMNTAEERFADGRLLDAIERGRSAPLGDGVNSLLDEIDRWRAGEKVHDDISILAVEFAAPRPPS